MEYLPYLYVKNLCYQCLLGPSSDEKGTQVPRESLLSAEFFRSGKRAEKEELSISVLIPV